MYQDFKLKAEGLGSGVENGGRSPRTSPSSQPRVLVAHIYIQTPYTYVLPLVGVENGRTEDVALFAQDLLPLINLPPRALGLSNYSVTSTCTPYSTGHVHSHAQKK